MTLYLVRRVVRYKQQRKRLVYSMQPSSDAHFLTRPPAQYRRQACNVSCIFVTNNAGICAIMQVNLYHAGAIFHIIYVNITLNVGRLIHASEAVI